MLVVGAYGRHYYWGCSMLKTQAEIIALVEQYATKLKNKLPHHIERVVLYGSCARGTYHDESDIDVMVMVILKTGTK